MNLGDLRRAIADLDLPDDTPVLAVVHDEDVTGGHGAAPSIYRGIDVKVALGRVEITARMAGEGG